MFLSCSLGCMGLLPQFFWVLGTGRACSWPQGRLGQGEDPLLSPVCRRAASCCCQPPIPCEPLSPHWLLTCCSWASPKGRRGGAAKEIPLQGFL